MLCGMRLTNPHHMCAADNAAARLLRVLTPHYTAVAHLMEVLQVLLVRLLQLMQGLEDHVGPNGVGQHQGGHLTDSLAGPSAYLP